MHHTLLSNCRVGGLALLLGAACSSRSPRGVTTEESANENAPSDSQRMSPVGERDSLEPDAALERAAARSSSKGDLDAGIGVGAGRGSDTASSFGGPRDGGRDLQLDSALAVETSPPTSATHDDLVSGDSVLDDAGGARSPTTNHDPATDTVSNTDSSTCFGGSDVADVGCDAILRDCPLDTDLVLRCFSTWNKSRSEVMQATLACFDSYGCKPGAVDAFQGCFEESSRRACIEDRADCSVLAGSCAALTKAHCEASLAPFHDTIRDKTMTCMSEAATADATQFEASCLQVFEECLGEVSSPVMF